MPIRSGSIVWLATGSPAMVVKEEQDEGFWMCTWFDGNAVCEHEFATNQLTETNPNPNEGRVDNVIDL